MVPLVLMAQMQSDKLFYGTDNFQGLSELDCYNLSSCAPYWFGECIDSRTYKYSRGLLAILSIVCVTTLCTNHR